LVNPFNPTRDEIIKENNSQEKFPVLDILVRKILPFSGVIIIVISWHLIRKPGEDEEANTEDDTPGTRDDERPGNSRNKNIISN